MLIREFEWDEENIQHVGRHGIDVLDIDAMLTARITVARNKNQSAGLYRFRGIGRGGRPITVIVARTATPGRWRPITARYGQ